jgi:peroxiredoxin
VSATVCGVSGFSIFDNLTVADLEAIPAIAVTGAGPSGHEIVGHVTAHVDREGFGTPNLLVLLARRGLEGTQILTKALAGAQRPGASVAAVVVAPSEVLSTASLSADIVYSADVDAWSKRLRSDGSDIETFIVAPSGKVVWRQPGSIDVTDLSAALEKHLSAGPPVNRLLFTSSARHGHAAPNFVFDYAPGRQLSLRKLAGRPTTIVFWTTRSDPSIAAVQEEAHHAADGATVLAVNVGDSSEVVAREAKRHKLTATVVNDPSGEIARGYGVSVFPTIVSIDASGTVAAIRYGKSGGHEHEHDSPKDAKGALRHA